MGKTEMTVPTRSRMTVTGIWLLAFLAAPSIQANTQSIDLPDSLQSFETGSSQEACDNPYTFECEAALRDFFENLGAHSKALFAYYYDNGILVEQNIDKALEWYTRAANEGDADAQKILGQKYELGTGVAQNYSKAIHWYTLAATQGHAEAQNNLAVMYAQGLGVQQDNAIALSWFRKSAAQENAEAQNSVGTIYDQGLGVPEDDTEAVRWFRAAAEQNLPKAQYNLGLMYLNARGVDGDDAEALRWFIKAGKRGFAEAQFFLGKMYNFGRGVEKEIGEAIRWYKLAADQGHVEARSTLGFFYLNDEEVPKDEQQAEKWLRLAAEDGSAGAQYNLGYLYLTQKQYTEAMHWYKLAAEDADMAKASYNVGLMYEQGLSVTQDNTQAAIWYQRGADLGHAKSAQRLNELSNLQRIDQPTVESASSSLAKGSDSEASQGLYGSFRGHAWGETRSEVKRIEGEPQGLFARSRDDHLLYPDMRLSDDYVAMASFSFDSQGGLREGAYLHIKKLNDIQTESPHADYLYFSSRLRKKYGDPIFEKEFVTNPLGHVLPNELSVSQGYLHLREAWTTGSSVIVHDVSMTPESGHKITWYTPHAFERYICFQKKLKAMAEGEDARLVDCGATSTDVEIDDAL